MKHTILLSFIVFFSFSCSKDDTEFPTNPKWLNKKIGLLQDSGFPGSAVYAYIWKDEYFYHIQNAISSCAYCEFYYYNGNKYQWQEGDYDDFFKNGKLVKVVWRN
jgi:hypothetical protein